MKRTPRDQQHPSFRIGVVASLLAGTLLMFGSLHYAATHMQVTM